MKKILLSCLALASMGVAAQINYVADFEADYGGPLYGQFGGGTQSTAAACNGTYGGQLAISATYTQTGFMVQLGSIAGQTNNGQKTDVSLSYKKAAGAVGTLYVAYFVLDPVANTWSVIPVGNSVSLTSAAVTTCNTITASIPAGALAPDKTVAVGAWFVRTSGSGNIYVDDITIAQETVTNVPSCATVTAPVAGSTVDAGNFAFNWSAVPTATKYKLQVGTTSGGSDIYNQEVSAISANVSLPVNSSFYAKVTPLNLNGEAVGCEEFTFNTNSNISYCGGFTATTPAATYPISSVTVNGQTNTSAATVGSPAYEDFTSTTFNAYLGTSSQIQIVGTGLGTNRFGATVFVDWNNDGDFNDEGERYFTSASDYLGGTGATITLNSTMAVPASATVGTKRMRVKYHFNSSVTTLRDELSDPCYNLITNGQVEDYTINLQPITTPPACTTISSPINGATVSTANPVAISWASSILASQYKVTVGTTSGASDIYSATVSGTSTSVVLPSSNPTYYINVIPTNNIGDATGCQEVVINTCQKIATFPYNENFDANSIPSCWSTVATSGSSVWTSVVANQNGSITPRGGSGRMIEFRTATVGNKAELILPEMDLTSLSNPAIKFHMANVNWAGDIDELRVYYKTSASGSWIELQTITDEHASWSKKVIQLPSKSSSYFIKFEATSNWARGMDLDDLTIDNEENLAVGTVTKSSVSLYPNPFVDVLNISDVKGVKSISVSDATGRTVSKLAPSTEINLSKLTSGVYVVTLQMEDGSVKSHKVIKK